MSASLARPILPTLFLALGLGSSTLSQRSGIDTVPVEEQRK
jgi:hypothetical protein